MEFPPSEYQVNQFANEIPQNEIWIPAIENEVYESETEVHQLKKKGS